MDVTREKAKAFLRIFQVIVTDIERHSQARKVWAYFEVREGMLTLEVEPTVLGINSRSCGRPRALSPLGRA